LNNIACIYAWLLGGFPFEIKLDAVIIGINRNFNKVNHGNPIFKM